MQRPERFISRFTSYPESGVLNEVGSPTGRVEAVGAYLSRFKRAAHSESDDAHMRSKTSLFCGQLRAASNPLPLQYELTRHSRGFLWTMMRPAEIKNKKKCETARRPRGCPRHRPVLGRTTRATKAPSTVPSFVPTTKPYRVLPNVGVKQPTASLRYTCTIP